MKITYEVGDIVEIYDDVGAGATAACTVQLVQKLSDGKWNTSIVEGWELPYGAKYIINESWFIP